MVQFTDLRGKTGADGLDATGGRPPVIHGSDFYGGGPPGPIPDGDIYIEQFSSANSGVMHQWKSGAWELNPNPDNVPLKGVIGPKGDQGKIATHDHRGSGLITSFPLTSVGWSLPILDGMAWDGKGPSLVYTFDTTAGTVDLNTAQWRSSLVIGGRYRVTGKAVIAYTTQPDPGDPAPYVVFHGDPSVRENLVVGQVLKFSYDTEWLNAGTVGGHGALGVAIFGGAGYVWLKDFTLTLLTDDAVVDWLPTTYGELWAESEHPIMPVAPVVSSAVVSTANASEAHITVPKSSDPDVTVGRVRVVLSRGAGVTSPWLGGWLESVDIETPDYNADLTAAFVTSPESAADPLFVTVFVWDSAGNGPVAAPAVAATIDYSVVIPPPKDTTPPPPPDITSVTWSEANDRFTLTIQAPNVPDLKEIWLWANPSNDVPPAASGNPLIKIPATSGQVLTYVYAKPPLIIPAGVLASGARWTDPASTHGVIQAAWTVVAVDQAGNKSAVDTAIQYIAQSRQTSPTPITLPAVKVSPTRSRAYDFRGTRADAQWGQGIMHTGQFPSGNHGIQWCGMWINPNDVRTIQGRTVTLLRLKWYSSHTASNSGATFGIGWHEFRSGMPATLPPSNRSAHFDTCGTVRVPKGGWVTKDIPLPIAQKVADGTCFGFIFGSMKWDDLAAYSALDVDSVSIRIVVR